MSKKANFLNRRSFFQGSVWSGVAIIGFASGGVRAEERLDASPAKIRQATPEEVRKHFPEPLARGHEAEVLAVTGSLGAGTNFIRISGMKQSAATVEFAGASGRGRVIIEAGDTPIASLSERRTDMGNAQFCGQGNFWSCWASCMLGKIGAGIWNNLKTKWLSCWYTAQKKKWWWQKVAAYIACICNLPYGSYAVSCAWSCR